MTDRTEDTPPEPQRLVPDTEEGRDTEEGPAVPDAPTEERVVVRPAPPNRSV